MTEVTERDGGVSRRALLRWGAAGGAGVALFGAQSVGRDYLAREGFLSTDGVFAAAARGADTALFTPSEVLPISPLILNPFTDQLPIPTALKPVPKAEFENWTSPPGPGRGQQNSLGNQQHQLWPDELRFPNGQRYPDPIVYQIKVEVAEHRLTTSRVRPINDQGVARSSFTGTVGGPSGNVSTVTGDRTLPDNTIYGFNGTFPGPRINAEYGKPVIVRFENHLDLDHGLELQDFGAPDRTFLTHLHNGHTAPESDGNPHYSMRHGPKAHGYAPGMWVDNLYLNWPAGGDDREKQSFFWFHDHRMDHTGSNVYKGMVGLYPIYDPKNGMDDGDERTGLRLPGVRTNHPDGTFDVAYDLPLAFYDCRLDDGVTVHHDFHDSEFAPNPNADQTRPEWWGRSFFKHMPHTGFVGDIYTVNGIAYPVYTVKRRKYRLRFLDASISRCYEFKLMSSTTPPVSAADLGQKGPDLEGQWRIPNGQQCMQFHQIASDGGLLPFMVTRDSFELWPAKRREFIVDFTKYMDGHPTSKGDEIYLTDIMQMPDGLEPKVSTRIDPRKLDPKFQTPVLKFIIGDNAPDDSVIPDPKQLLRAVPPLPGNWQSLMDDRKQFHVTRANQANGELQWVVNDRIFDPSVLGTATLPNGTTTPAVQKKNSFALWEISSGGAWVHPFHNHMEEHRTVMRGGTSLSNIVDPNDPDQQKFFNEDWSREDLTNLETKVIFYRGFRDFVGPYVSHCHNLAHEDHAMMFGWEIVP